MTTDLPRLSPLAIAPGGWQSREILSGCREQLRADRRSSSTPATTDMAGNNSSPRGSNAWTRDDDDALLECRRKGLGWKGVQENFPNKTSNACRKHHERLVESRKNAEDWPPEKMELLAKEYLAHRKEIWTKLAAPTGEKWATAEAKVSYIRAEDQC